MIALRLCRCNDHHRHQAHAAAIQDLMTKSIEDMYYSIYPGMNESRFFQKLENVVPGTVACASTLKNPDLAMLAQTKNMLANFSLSRIGNTIAVARDMAEASVKKGVEAFENSKWMESLVVNGLSAQTTCKVTVGDLKFGAPKSGYSDITLTINNVRFLNPTGASRPYAVAVDRMEIVLDPGKTAKTQRAQFKDIRMSGVDARVERIGGNLNIGLRSNTQSEIPMTNVTIRDAKFAYQHDSGTFSGGCATAARRCGKTPDAHRAAKLCQGNGPMAV